MLSHRVFLCLAFGCVACSPSNPTGVGGEAHAGDGNGGNAEGGQSTAGGTQVGAGPAGGGGAGGVDDAIIPAAVSCSPTSAACAAAAPDLDLLASYRKDHFLPSSKYDEPNPEPTTGGRVQVVAVAARNGPVTQVLVDGVDVSLIDQPNPPSAPPFEWAHVWPSQAVAGEPIWVSFHSVDAKWDNVAAAELAIQSAGGTIVSGTFPVAATELPLTYVTTRGAGSSVLLHLRNDSGAPHTISGVSLNGKNVLGAGITCVAEPLVQPGESRMIDVPLCEPIEAGSAWTAVVRWDDAPPSVGAGRVLPELFPIETWMTTSDCALPGGNDAAYQQHTAAGIDTIWFHGGTCSECGCNSEDLLADLASSGDYHLVVTDDVVGADTSYSDVSAIAAVATGDESDGEIYDSNGVPNAAQRAAVARDLWKRYPSLPVYNGGKTNRNVGSFAGMTDIQGMDFYIAGCAPHITAWGTHPPIDAAYDYLLNARNNMMPLPTWLYAQGLHPGWNRQLPIVGTTIHVQPSPAELLIQGASVIAAGGKGFMWFQSTLDEADESPERWAAMSQVGRWLQGVRPLLREGDLAALATSTEAEVLASAIRGPQAIVVSVIDFATEAGPTDVACATILSADSVPHWTLASRTFDLEVVVPTDMAIRDVFEITLAGVISEAPVVVGPARLLRLEGVQLEQATPVRMFVFASSDSVRQQVLDGMAY